MTSLPDREIVIIGGGAIGCGVAYALARAGHRDILVVERASEVAQVTTSQGAGLCGQVRDSAERIRLAMHSVATFRELEKDPDVRPEWREVGSIRIALTEARAEEFRRLERLCRKTGLEVELLSGPEAYQRWPVFQLRGAVSVLWCPGDGYMAPQSVARSYEHQCRTMGVYFATDTSLSGVAFRNGRVEGIKTNRGSAACRIIINAAGAHACHVARLAGLDLPIIPVRHEYFVTAPIPGMNPTIPCFRVPELALYGRAVGPGLLLGGWEREPVSLDPGEFTLAGRPPAVETDWDVLNQFELDFAGLYPAVTGKEKIRVGKGWPTFTPDGRFIIGESSQVRGFVMAGGCNAHGISGSAGIGKLLVESLFDPNPSSYVRSLSPDRFTGTPWDWRQARSQAEGIYGTYYGC